MKARCARFVVGAVAALLVLSPATALAGTKFRVEFTGHVDGTWQRVTGMGTRCGAPTEESGSFSTTVGPLVRPKYVTVYKAFGRLGFKWPKGDAEASSRITSMRAAQGWLTQGDCYPYDDPFAHIEIGNPRCWAPTTFVGPVALYAVSGSFNSMTREPVAPVWQVQPLGSEVGCNVGPFDFGDENDEYLNQLARPMNWAALYTCGKAKPRACRKSIGGSRTFTKRVETHGYNYPTRSGATIVTETVNVGWSVRFVAVGRVADVR